MQESPPQNVVAFPLGCLLEIGIKLSTWSYFVFPPKFISWTCPLFIKCSSKRFVSTNISLCGCRVTSVTFLPLLDTEIEAQVATWCGQGFDAHPLSASVPFLITSRRASLTTRVSGPGDEKSVSTPLFYCCCVCVCVCVCESVHTHPHVHTCALICPPCFFRSVQLCSVAQSCLGEQTALIGLHGLDFSLHVQDSWHGVQSKTQGSGVPGFQSRLCCLLDVQTEMNSPTSLSFGGLREADTCLWGLLGVWDQIVHVKCSAQNWMHHKGSVTANVIIFTIYSNFHPSGL